MEQDKFEKLLKGAGCVFKREDDPHPHVVITNIKPQHRCEDCDCKLKKTRFVTHRRDRLGDWNSYCQYCTKHKNPATGQYDIPRGAYSKVNKIKESLVKTVSERTGNLLQRLANLSASTGNDSSGNPGPDQ